MKSGKRKTIHNGQKPNMNLWAGVSLAVGFVAYVDTNWFNWFFNRGTKTAQAAVEDDEPDDRMQYVRGALFTNNGYAFDRRNNDKSDHEQLEIIQARAEDRRSRFSKADYWEERYKKTTKEFDWFGTWNSDTAIRIKPEVEPFFPSQINSILNIGCGNSRLGEELYKDGYKGIMNIDISQSAVDKMSQKFAGNSELSFMQMDITNMTFADASFDVVMDKGTLDALYTGLPAGVKLAVAHIYRMLTPGGVFVSMSFGAPINRRDLNSTSGVEGELGGWGSFETTVLRREDQDYHLYLMTKPN